MTEAPTPLPDPTTLRALVEAATRPRRTEEPAARFALLPAPGSDPAALSAGILDDLAALNPRIAPFSASDDRLLVLELGDRALRRDEGAVFEAAYALAARHGLEAAEPAYPANVFPEPGLDDPETAPDAREQAFIPGCEVPRDPTLPLDWALRSIRARQAWALPPLAGGAARGLGVIFAQPDTGVATHDELDHTRRAAGFDFIDGDPDPTDPLNYSGSIGHGTSTGSVVVSSSSGRISGAAPDVTHMPLRAIRNVVLISQVEVAQAIDWAVEHDAEVISLSLGGLPSISIERAIARAVAKDVIVLAAAGNCVTQVVWPARYPNCIAVAGVDHLDQPWSGTCRGPDVDIAAPAENVWAAKAVVGQPGASEISQGQGTSYAVALAAAAAALWLAHHGRDKLRAAARTNGETLQAMFRRLARRTARAPVGWDARQMGAEVINCEALLQAPLATGGGEATAVLAAVPADLGIGQFMAEHARLSGLHEAGPSEAAPPAAELAALTPEISLHLLRRRLPPAAGGTEAARTPRLSPSLQRRAPAALRRLLGEAPAPQQAQGPTPFGWSASLTGAAGATEAAAAADASPAPTAQAPAPPAQAASFLELYDAIPEADVPARVALLSGRLQTDWRNLFAELRRDRPVFVTPLFTMITQRGDVIEALAQHQLFSVRGYAPKMDPSVGPFMLARDETELNWHDKALMRSLLRLDDLPRIRGVVADAVRETPDGDTIELVGAVGRRAPLRVVQRYFGFPGPDDATMLRWSRASQADMFRNPTNDPAVHAANVTAGQEMQAYVRGLLEEKRARLDCDGGGDDAVSRLLRIAAAGEVGMSADRVVSNVCGLLVGAIETASQAIVQAVEQILSRPEIKEQALTAAQAQDPAAFDAIVWEALRFNPMTTLVFRFVERDTTLAPGAPYATPVKAGEVVAVCTGSAMLDGDAIPDADAFRPGRPADVYMHLGFGHHECLGKYVGMAMVPEAVRQVLLLPEVALLDGPAGRIDFQNGPFPERFVVRRAQASVPAECATR